MKVPKAFLWPNWKGWRLVEGPGMATRMKREFEDADDCTHFITISPSGFFEIYNVDGEIAWYGKFPSVERAHRAAMEIIKGMAR